MILDIVWGIAVIFIIIGMVYVSATTPSPHEWMVKNYKDIIE